ncbi:MAG: DinB family protein [Acidobacteriaceae bacterium]|nr:DinB family protein [Acidobacteriaceae bacterium]
MKKLLIALLLSPLWPVFGQVQNSPTSLKSILLEQLRSTHNKSEWFVCAKVAVEGLTPEQARWKDKSGNHSISELVNHLTFWNTRALQKFQGATQAAFNGNNEETFTKALEAGSWEDAVKKLDEVLTAWEKAVEGASDEKLKASASTIAHIGTHNAYHIGQIVYIRRLQGSWDPKKGVS